MTTIYFMRHSEPFKTINCCNSESLQIQNEKMPLSLNGEKIAGEKRENLKDISFDVVFSSNYVRAISTARYFSNNVLIDENFGERKFGVSNYNEIPENFYIKQFNDFSYKIGNGECLNEVLHREKKSIERILKDYKDKNILIVGHSTALTALLSQWCEITYEYYKYKDRIINKDKMDFCATFKMIFDNDTLVDIFRI